MPVRSCVVADRITVGVRPEGFLIHPDGDFSGQIEVVEHLGSRAFLHVRTPEGGRLVLIDAGDTDARPGVRLQFTVLPNRAHLFDSTGSTLNPFAGGAQ